MSEVITCEGERLRAAWMRKAERGGEFLQDFADHAVGLHEGLCDLYAMSLTPDEEAHLDVAVAELEELMELRLVEKKVRP